MAKKDRTLGELGVEQASGFTKDTLVLAVGGVGGAFLVPVAGPAAPLVGAGIAKAGERAVSLLWAAGKAAQQRRADFEKAMRYELALSSDLGIEDALEDPQTAQSVLHSFRTAMDALDAAVLPALARLLRRYQNRPLDPFFRSASNLLRDCGSREFAALQEMLALAEETPIEATFVRLAHGEHNRRNHVEVSFITTTGSSSFEDAGPTGQVQFAELWEHLFDALAGHGLAKRDPQAHESWGTGSYGTNSGTIGLMLRRETVSGLAGVLGSSAVPAPADDDGVEAPATVEGEPQD